MKKLVIFVGILYSFSTVAQVQKGKVGIYTGISVQSIKNTNLAIIPGNADLTYDTKNTNFIFGIGTFVSGRVFIGANVGYSNQNQKQVTPIFTGDATIESIPIGLVFKWYKKLGNKFYYNVNLNGTYEHMIGEQKYTYTSSTPTTSTSKATSDRYTGRISPLQISYAVSSKFLVEAGFAYIEYSNSKTKNESNPAAGAIYGDSRSNMFNINLSPSVANFTVSYFF
jgi:hypothetical protein